MATLEEIKTIVNDKLTAIWPTVKSKQDNYFGTTGGYWQGLISHGTIPTDGTSTTPNIGTKTPTDQPDPWPATWRNDSYPMAARFDVYDGPLGKGYVATVFVKVKTKIYSRARNVGPETWRTFGWKDVTPP